MADNNNHTPNNFPNIIIFKILSFVLKNSFIDVKYKFQLIFINKRLLEYIQESYFFKLRINQIEVVDQLSEHLENQYCILRKPKLLQIFNHEIYFNGLKTRPLLLSFKSLFKSISRLEIFYGVNQVIPLDKETFPNLQELFIDSMNYHLNQNESRIPESEFNDIPPISKLQLAGHLGDIIKLSVFLSTCKSSLKELKVTSTSTYTKGYVNTIDQFEQVLLDLVPHQMEKFDIYLRPFEWPIQVLINQMNSLKSLSLSYCNDEILSLVSQCQFLEECEFLIREYEVLNSLLLILNHKPKITIVTLDYSNQYLNRESPLKQQYTDCQDERWVPLEYVQIFNLKSDTPSIDNFFESNLTGSSSIVELSISLQYQYTNDYKSLHQYLQSNLNLRTLSLNISPENIVGSKGQSLCQTLCQCTSLTELNVSTNLYLKDRYFVTLFQNIHLSPSIQVISISNEGQNELNPEYQPKSPFVIGRFYKRYSIITNAMNNYFTLFFYKPTDPNSYTCRTTDTLKTPQASNANIFTYFKSLIWK
ncbi:hypothetical protein DLAC_05834 [Tieghemostelium lacteum]|uniref:Uncharacterized protein n=1 Tax=Tieghemostelium lacteum TaxID=361077 RepID=A0A151ZGU9_TIELA|nr:hypothetical protein DLAC_05834 [Tieghemostelium lacteum]|eukprot:KYQ93196.1 hypothetical protein DLAC_05834 [Tieghemostelium lacteum]